MSHTAVADARAASAAAISMTRRNPATKADWIALFAPSRSRGDASRGIGIAARRVACAWMLDRIAGFDTSR